MTNEQLRKKIEKIYLAPKLKQNIAVSVMGREVELPCKDLADGCVGVSLWFEDEKSAK